MNILITGVCGLIGSRIAANLVAQQHNVYGIGRSGCDPVRDLLSSRYINQDLALEGALENIKNGLLDDIDVIIHCAAQQPRSCLTFKDYLKANVEVTDTIVELAKSLNIGAIISFSTAAFLEFPLEDGIGLTESASVCPRNYYALSKSISESYLRLCENNGISIVCLRIPSLVHEQQEGGIIQTYFQHALQNKNLEVYDCGKYRRNLIYINSILEIVELLLERIGAMRGFNLYHIGSKDSWTLMEIAAYIFKQVNSRARVIPCPLPGTAPGHWNLDVSKAVNELGFSPWQTSRLLNAYLANKRGELD